MLGIKFLLFGIEISLLLIFWSLSKIASYFDRINRKLNDLDVD